MSSGKSIRNLKAGFCIALPISHKAGGLVEAHYEITLSSIQVDE